MNPLTRSFIAYMRGETENSLWGLVRPLGWVGALVVKTRCAFYDHGIFASEEAPLPVISVGNLTMGGTNKTPFVEFVAEHLRAAGIKPGIISRGYGGKASSPVIILNGNAERSLVGDEPLMLSGRLRDVPVAVSRDRLADITALLSCDVDVVVADDAFQHRRMARDLDIVLVDAVCPFGNGAPLPVGVLREIPSSLSRAHIVVISKSDQATPEVLEGLRKKLTQWVPEEKIFYSRLGAPDWSSWDGKSFCHLENGVADYRLLTFAGIGNPKSFLRTVENNGGHSVRNLVFKDHHKYSAADMRHIEQAAGADGADAICCTEKDIYNLPAGFVPKIPLIVPRISTQLDDSERFWKIAVETLRPKLVIASNGYGEDAIGARLAVKVRDAFPAAQVRAFPLVGQGKDYQNCGIQIDAPLSDSPTGGIIKYHLRDLIREIRAGLFGHIGSQLRGWKELHSNCRTVICVGDAYLLCHTLWGQGKKAILIATAKTQFISGHWKLESFIYSKGCKKVWTRDEETAVALREKNVNAVFDGNPIMDLSCDNINEVNCWGDGRRVLVLPGSRERTYRDLPLLLSALELLSEKCRLSVVMVLAQSIDLEKLLHAAKGWTAEGESLLCRGDVKITLFRGEVAAAARGAELLLGLAGTANQVCAGLGIPVLSVKEKGKFVQKKLLGEAELLVDASPERLAEAASELLNDPERLAYMGSVGRSRLGQSGALDAVVQYAADELGWRRKCALYERLRERFCDLWN